jgi:hypothetical protein
LGGWWKAEHFDWLAQTAKYSGSAGCRVEEEKKLWSEAKSHKIEGRNKMKDHWCNSVME